MLFSLPALPSACDSQSRALDFQLSLSIKNLILRWQKLLVLLLVFGATVFGLNIDGHPTGGVVTGQTYTITYSRGVA
jgi:hypothetical protein